MKLSLGICLFNAHALIIDACKNKCTDHRCDNLRRTPIISKNDTIKVLPHTNDHHALSQELKLHTQLCGYKRFDTDKQCVSSGSVESLGADSVYHDDKTVLIADGVGGWVNLGVDPTYSQGVVRNIVNINDRRQRSLLKNVEQSYKEIGTAGIEGSTTLLYSRISKNKLEIYNLGDCNLLVIRNGTIFRRAGTQQYRFNYPYQLSSNDISSPNDGNRLTLTVQKGDIIVSGSDGVWDNIEFEDVVKFLAKRTTLQIKSETTTRKLLKNVYTNKNNDSYAGRSSGSLGGTEDDTVLAVSIVE